MYILTSSQMKTAEGLCVDREGITYTELMERAGKRSAEIIVAQSEPCSALVICGKGKNGGDGFVIARYLKSNGYNVKILLACGLPKAEDSVKMFSAVENSGIPITSYTGDLQAVSDILKSSDIIVECIFGTGFTGKPTPELASLFSAINNSPAKKYCIDIPAGTDCDNSVIEGTAVKADITIAISTIKPAHIIKPISGICGKTLIADIGITEQEHKESGTGCFTFLTPDEVKPFLPDRPSVSNKGTFGNVLNICGSMKYQGAAVMAAKGACRMGAGLVTAAFPDKAYPAVSAKLTEPVMLPLASDENGFLCSDAYKDITPCLKKASAVLAGCGMGNTQATKNIIFNLLSDCEVPLLLDADALNVLSGCTDILKESRADIVITPHHGEMSRLTGKAISEILSEPVKAASGFAKQYNVTVVLKGANTVITTPEGQVYVNSSGNNMLAKGGSGDLLAGMLVSLLAQGMKTFEAACAAVYLHGLCADRYITTHSSRCSLPSDIADNMSIILADFAE